MSRHSSLPSLQRRSCSASAASDIAGEITVDQFLSRCSYLAGQHADDADLDTVSPLSSPRPALRRTAIRRPLPAARAGAGGALSSPDGSALSRSERALARTERSAVLADAGLSEGDSDWSPARAGPPFESPSPDNRRGTKPPPPRRKSLLERWEEVRGEPRAAPAVGLQLAPLRGALSSSESCADGEASPRQPRAAARAESRGEAGLDETGSESRHSGSMAWRPDSGTDSTRGTPRDVRVPQPAPKTGPASLFDDGHVESLSDAIEAVLSPRTSSTLQSPRPARRHTPDDLFDRASRPLHPTTTPSASKPASSPASATGANTERERRDAGAQRGVASHAAVMERLAQVMAAHRLRRGAVRASPQPSGGDPGREVAPVKSVKPVEPPVESPEGRPPAGRRRSRSRSRSRAGPALRSPRRYDPRRVGVTAYPPAGWQPRSPLAPDHFTPVSPDHFTPAGPDHFTAVRPDQFTAVEEDHFTPVSRFHCLGAPRPASAGSLEELAWPESPAPALRDAFRDRGWPGFFLGSPGAAGAAEAGALGWLADAVAVRAGRAPETTLLPPLRLGRADRDTALDVNDSAREQSEDRLTDSAYRPVSATPIQRVLTRHVLKWTAVSTTVLTVTVGLVLIVVLLA